MKRLLAVGLLGALGYALANRRRLAPERLDVYREDGTIETYEAGSLQGDRALSLTREILST